MLHKVDIIYNRRVSTGYGGFTLGLTESFEVKDEAELDEAHDFVVDMVERWIAKRLKALQIPDGVEKSAEYWRRKVLEEQR